MDQPLSKLFMYKSSLDDLPELELPAGFSLRHFAPGEEEVWERLIEASFGTKITFHEKIGRFPHFRPEKVLFVCSGSAPAATATAFQNEMTDEHTGYLHMVGALPEYAGRGLGYGATLAALHRMKSEGRTSALLKTDDFRLPAIKVYWKLGFRPKFMDDSQYERWDRIQTAIQLK